MITPLRPRLLELERSAVSDALETAGGDVRAAARLLGVPERTLWRRIPLLGLSDAVARHKALAKLADSRPA